MPPTPTPSKKRKADSAAPPVPSRACFDLLQDGERLSRCVYYQVQKVDSDKGTVVIKNQDGLSIEMNRRVVEEEMYSASQVTQVEKLCRGAVVKQLMEAGNTVFTVVFHKQLDIKTMAEQLKMSLDKLESMPDRQFKTFCRLLVQGEERTMTGYLVSSEPTLGRSRVFDLEIGEERPVDHRTLQSIIIRGIKYQVK